MYLDPIHQSYFKIYPIFVSVSVHQISIIINPSKSLIRNINRDEIFNTEHKQQIRQEGDILKDII